jgi:hypothetical protein
MRRHRLLEAIALLTTTIVATAATAQSPSLTIHQLDFYVHVDTLASSTLDLAGFQAAIDDAMVDARLILQGEHGPVDAPCCTELRRPNAVATFGVSGDMLDVIDFTNDLAALQAAAGGREAVFIVDALSFCGGVPAAGAIGCAETPGQIQVVTTGALERALLGTTVAHERGHNAGLDHITPNTCDMMQAIAGGSCLPVADCADYRGIGAATADTCACHADAVSKLADGSLCTDGGLSGVCSGGVCGESGGEASTRLVAAADPAGGALFDSLVSGSGLTGDWQVETTIGSNDFPTGLAYAPERSTLYGVRTASASDGELLEIDPTSGAVMRRTTLPGLPGLISLAWDPGAAGPADDRLLAVDRQPQVGDSQIEELIAIDPDDGAVSPVCELVNNSQETSQGFFSGLAYDAANGTLLGNGQAGLFEISEGSPNCGLAGIDHPGTSSAVNLARGPGALGYSDETGLVFLLGSQSGGQTLYTLVDAGAAPAPFVSTTYGVDTMTLGGLAAMPVPEPGAGPLGVATLATLVTLRRARRSRAHSTAMRPAPRP